MEDSRVPKETGSYGRYKIQKRRTLKTFKRRTTKFKKNFGRKF